MKPRRILIFSHAYYPKLIGGAEVAVKEITDRIVPGELEFEMITINAGGELKKDKIGNVNIHRLFNSFGIVQKLLFPFAAYFKAKKLHEASRYDAVWSIMASYAGFAGFLFKRKYSKVPMILTIQEGDHFERRAGIFGPIFKKIFRAADRIQVISKFLADWAREMGATCSITVVPNGVDIQLFSRQVPEEDMTVIQGLYGRAPGDVFLVTTSRLVEKNAVDDVIAALALLPANFKFMVMGTGPKKAELVAQAKKLGVDLRVTFLNFVKHEYLPPYLKACDIFVRPSRTEGLGNSFLEAMAADIPVIATPVGGIPDFLTDGETGLFCEVNNPQSIARKVEKLTRDRESRDYIVRAARKMVEERYDWSSIAGEMKQVLVGAIK